MKPVRTLILLASEGRFLLVENAGVGKGVTEIMSHEAADFPDLPAGYADAPGRSQAATGMARHDFDRPTPQRDQRREAFADRIVSLTLETWEKGHYDQLIVVAPPRMLGSLRTALPDDLAGAVVADLDKDLTKLPLAELPKHLASVLAV